MKGAYGRLIKPIYLVGDIFAIIASFLFSYHLTFNGYEGFSSNYYLSLLFFFIVGWSFTSYLTNSFKVYRVTGWINILGSLVKSLIVFIALIELYVGFVAQLFNYSYKHIRLSYLFICILIILWRVIIIYWLRVYRKLGYNYKRVIIAGFGESAEDLLSFFKNHPENGYRFMGAFDNNQMPGDTIIGKLSEIENFSKDNLIDEIYCSASEIKDDVLERLIDFSDKNFISIKILPALSELRHTKFKLDLYGQLPVMVYRNIPLDDVINKWMKRSFDVLFSFLVCIFILSWITPFLAILIKWNSKGPVFFQQERSGLNNRGFFCYKLRTMYVNSDSHVKQATIDDPRITSLGKFLRKYNLDELPQFFNVLLGNMSIVGPRPHMLKHTEEYSAMFSDYLVRHTIKPGITGLSQVMGLRGETTDPAKMNKRVKMDIYYIENWSFFLDVKIILKTLFL